MTDFISTKIRRPANLSTAAISETMAGVKLFTSNTSYVRVPIKVRTKKEENKVPKKAVPRKANAAVKAVADNDLSSELNEPRWSVVSFESRAANGLTYEEAARKLAELAAEKVSGLCIITDEAGEKVKSKKAKGKS